MTTFRTNFAAALPVIASVSILAVTVGGGDGKCTGLSPLRACSNLYPAALSTPKPRLDSPRRSAHCSVFRPEQSGSHKEVVILVTIEACLMVDTDDRPWGRHTRDHWNRENGKKSRRPKQH